MNNLKENEKLKEINLYVIFGILTTIINLILYEMCIFVKFDYKISNTIAFIISIIFAFVTNKIYVFRSKCNKINFLIKEILLFFISRIFTYILEIFLLILFIDLFYLNITISKLVTTIIVVVLNYILSKTSVFKKEVK